MHPKNVICPTCGAGIGMPCKDVLYGYPIATIHQTRIDAAGPRR